MAEPVRALQTSLSLTLDPVRFEGGRLWKARYPSLIDDNFPRKFQFEPAFQVCSEAPDQEVEVVFRIADEENAVFETLLGGEVSWQLLVPPNPETPAPDVSVTLWDGDLRRCRVLWRRSGAPLSALRISCRHAEGGPPPDTDEWALTRVEGGVYLAIIDRGTTCIDHEPVRNPAGTRESGRVRVVGLANGRPVYDLFREDFSVPPEISLEPAFRMSHGEHRDFRLALDLPEPYAGVRFKTSPDGQVEMTHAVPIWKPGELLGTPASEDGCLCTIEWRRDALLSCVSHTPDAHTDTCGQGRTANLYAQLDPGPPGALRPELAAVIANASVDPTVIEPPACDASGVCTKPRDRVGE